MRRLLAIALIRLAHRCDDLAERLDKKAASDEAHRLYEEWFAKEVQR